MLANRQIGSTSYPVFSKNFQRLEGKDAWRNNLELAALVASKIASCLGPTGAYKLVTYHQGPKLVTKVTKDAVDIVDELGVHYPGNQDSGGGREDSQGRSRRRSLYAPRSGLRPLERSSEVNGDGSPSRRYFGWIQRSGEEVDLDYRRDRFRILRRPPRQSAPSDRLRKRAAE